MENMENAARKKVMLSGIQPSGDLTLGSYLGAIKNWAERDEEFDNYYFMADMHSIITPAWSDTCGSCRPPNTTLLLLTATALEHQIWSMRFLAAASGASRQPSMASTTV